jgi:hypothetical protein
MRKILAMLALMVPLVISATACQPEEGVYEEEEVVEE